MADLYPILLGSAPSQGGAQDVGNKAWNLSVSNSNSGGTWGLK